jgi:Cd2+/Zn2+-exporting ATPase
VAHHPPAESELQELGNTLVVACDRREVLIARTAPDATAAVTTNRNLVFIARQFVWMELFAQRIYAQLGPALLAKLDEEDRRIFEDMAGASD